MSLSDNLTGCYEDIDVHCAREESSPLFVDMFHIGAFSANRFSRQKLPPFGLGAANSALRVIGSWLFFHFANLVPHMMDICRDGQDNYSW